MKRNMKSVITVLLALVMTLCMAQSAFAEEPAAAAPTKTLGITNTTAGNEFAVYQVMTARVVGKDTDGKDLYEYTPTEAFAPFFAKGGDSGYTLDVNGQIVPEVATDGLKVNDNTTAAAALAAALERFAIANSIAPIAELKDPYETTQPIGYYVVAQTKNASNEDGKANDGAEIASKPILVDLVEDKTGIALKNETITLDKVIVEDGDKKANDVNIGDVVEFKITTKLPKYEANIGNQELIAESLKFTLTDTFSDGFTYDFAGKTAEQALRIDNFDSEEYTVTVNGQVLTIDFPAETILAHQGESVVVHYCAELNNKAVVDSTEGNPNTVKLEYFHNPNETGDGKYKELEDETKTYTYGFGIHKVEPNREGGADKNLADAVFTIEDEDGDGNLIQFVKDGDSYVKATEEQLADNSIKKTTEIISSASGAVDVKGLDEGKYKITETVAPDDYTKLAAPIELTITAITENEKPTGKATLAVSENAQIEDADGNKTGSAELDGSTINLNVYVVNYLGITLPETGATSAMFCMIGGIAILLLAGLYYEFAVRRAKDVK